MEAYWYQVCPKCDGQGRLVLSKRDETGKLFIRCDECESAWNSVEEICDKKKIFLSLDVPSSYATLKEAETYGWGKLAKHKYVR